MQTSSQTLDRINYLCTQRQGLWRAKWTRRNAPEYREELKSLNYQIDRLWKLHRAEMAGSVPIHTPKPDFDYSDLSNRQVSSPYKWQLDKKAEPLPYSDTDWDEEPRAVEIVPLKEILKKRGKTLIYNERGHFSYEVSLST